MLCSLSSNVFGHAFRGQGYGYSIYYLLYTEKERCTARARDERPVSEEKPPGYIRRSNHISGAGETLLVLC